MFSCDDTTSIPILALNSKTLEAWLQEQSLVLQTWVKHNNFLAEAGKVLLVPDHTGALMVVLLGVMPQDLWALGDLPKLLPTGLYHLDNRFNLLNEEQAVLGYGLGHYCFDRYKQKKPHYASQLKIAHKLYDAVWPSVEALSWVRDLINTPAEDLNPETFSAHIKTFANEQGFSFHEIVGEDLLKHRYHAIYTVGKGASRAPRLLDLSIGNSAHPKLTLVGKGVCFDSGGLNLKSGDGMLTMKKDMGGAAHALGLAKLIIAAGLKVRLRLLLPVVENSISSRAYHPGDILKMRNGLHVEIGNTDAEGRLILADALCEAASEQPDLIIDFATLTGARSVALGNQIVALFSNDEAIGLELMACGKQLADPIWPLPLYQPYLRMIKGKVGDISNSGGPYAGAITAALFLQQFVPATTPWVHLDFSAWNEVALPGRPEGGEVMSIRALLQWLSHTYLQV